MVAPSRARAAQPPAEGAPGSGPVRTAAAAAPARPDDPAGALGVPAQSGATALPHPRPPTLPAAARRLILGVDLAALAVLVVAAALAVDAHVSAVRIVLAAALLAAGESRLVTVRFGGDAESYSMMEATLILALPMVPWPWLTIAALGTLVSQLASRRSPVKVGYNVATSVVGVAVGGGLAHLAAGGTPDLDSGRGVAGLLVAAVVYWLWSTLAVACVLAASTGQPLREVVQLGRALRFLVVGVNIGLALWAQAVAAKAPLALAILPVVVALLLWAYRGYVRATRDRDLWRQLEQAAKELNRLDEERVLDVAVTQALLLFKADAAAIVLRGRRADDRPRARLAQRGSGPLPVGWDIPEPGRVPVDVEVAPIGRGDVTLVRVPLPEVGGLTGQLRLCFVGNAYPEPRDRQVLRTFAHTVAASLVTAELYQEVSELARRKSHEADHDPLTGLANRTLLIRRAEEAISSARDGRTVAVALLDLDHFKHVNDTLGHAAGDALLVAVSERLPEFVRSRDTVARLGGDEFALLLTDLACPEQAERIVADVMRVVSEPVTVAGVELSVQASAGIACHPVDAPDVHGLLQRADTAMYAAKRTRGSYRRFDGAGEVETGLLRLALGAELRRALAQEEFDVHYQPQVEVGTGRVVGFEALVRWRHPDRGLLLPSDFIAVVEQSGFIGEFTLHVLDRAIEACLSWPVEPGRPLTVAVNLSARNLLDRSFGEEVMALLAAHGLPAGRLVLEITETTMLGELDVVEEVLSVLRRHGVQLSVDDFGTGYSSLTFLQRVRVNELKIDRAFVGAMLDSPQAAALVRATVELARSFGLRTVAEGVESAEVLTELTALGCEVVQGFYFGEPVPAAQVGRVVAAARR